MQLSQIDIINILTKRTFEAKKSYYQKLGIENLYCYSGTQDEISNLLMDLSKNGNQSKYPAIFNILPARQVVSGNKRDFYNTICIVSPVRPDAKSEEREKEEFETIIRPIYDEFMKQVFNADFLTITEYGIPEHTYYDNYAVANEQSVILEKYGEYISAIEIHNLKLTIDSNICENTIKQALGLRDCIKN